ncbi:MAG: ComF family protein [Dysosmobacter welbionis]
MSLLSALLDLIFPAKCPFCGRVLDRPGICGTCRGELPWTEGADALRRGPGGFLCAAPLWYQGLAREGLHRFKFRGMSSAAAPLGELIAGCAAEHFSGAFDTVTWVPVSPQAPASAGV